MQLDILIGFFIAIGGYIISKMWIILNSDQTKSDEFAPL